jgi:hypothetical protein
MLKHIGRMVKNGRKVIVAYKVVPNEPDQCIVVTTENLMAEEHDTLIKLVESAAGQEADDLATVMSRTPLPDGRNMLVAFHTTGKMVKVPTNTVEMTPTIQSKIMLSELNDLIAQQRGVTVADLAIGGSTAPKQEAVPASAVVEPTAVEPAQAITDGVLTDEDLARQYRSQADRLSKEAAELRRQAEELVPTKRTTKKTEESA